MKAIFKTRRKRGRGLNDLASNQRGQAAVEYLMVTALVFAMAFLMINGEESPFGKGAKLIIGLATGPLYEIVRNGQITPGGQETQFGSSRHPAANERMKRLH